jgi:hypothetical protein
MSEPICLGIVSAVVAQVIGGIILVLLTRRREVIQTLFLRLGCLAVAIGVLVFLVVSYFPNAGPRLIIPTATPTPTQFQTFRVKVVYSGKEGLNIRDAPNGNIIAKLLENSELTVKGEAEDADGLRWRPVEVGQGWIAEGTADEYSPRWLAPVNTNMIEVNQPVRVVYSGKDGLYLRRNPDLGSDVIAIFLKDSYLTIIGGPELGGGFRWWRVSIAPGWVAEGKVDTSEPRWLKPITR